MRASPSPRRKVSLLFSLVTVGTLLSGDAGAVIEQTDGSVVPVLGAPGYVCPGATNSCAQTPLNLGEGFPAAAANNPLHAIFSAAISPEVFSIPKKNGVFGQVKVDDLQEGAGYENSFGWYNVNAPANLYVITPCADEVPSSRMVDFQVEFTQGRYLGGFIGFFLITPENQPVANNCGSLNDVGHIYYTEQAKNGDGNYVHYLLYHSLKDNLAYYFGFEDLFRGGDNDFDDMFLKVTGLLAPCVPSPEVCDGKDNNCDGLIDNMPIDAGGPCGLPNVGVCKDGTLQCANGMLICVGSVGPSQEVCDNLDNNCNGVVDDNPVGVGAACGSSVGECKPGATQCIGGVLTCLGGKGPTLEICDTLDNDCNGMADDNPVDTGGPCGSNVGVCNPGVLTCVGGMVNCVGGKGPTPELCDSLDNDCNGAIDDGDPGSGMACGSDVGVCEPGVTHCLGGMLQCVGAVGPGPELCDGLDNDCDGVGDNLAPCPNGSQCVSGACAEPCQMGEFPCPGGQICVKGFCVPGSCDSVTCPPDQVCMQGLCIPSSDGGVDGGGSGSGGGSASTSSAGSGSSSSSGSASSGGQGGAGSNHKWGLATGGGGLLCSLNEGPGEGPGAVTTLGLGALALALARRRRAARGRSARRAS